MAEGPIAMLWGGVGSGPISHTCWKEDPPDSLYSTEFGAAFAMDAIDVLRKLKDSSVDLILTSPPFPLHRKKPYGNHAPDQYGLWFLKFAHEFHRILKPKGSLVLELPDGWIRGEPTKSLFGYEIILQLSRIFHLAQDFYWFNTAKLPTPAEWVTIRRERVKDAITPIWWLSKSPHPKANNRRVLAPYSAAMISLLERGYNPGPRPSGHVISGKWKRNNGGAIPPNLLVSANTDSNSDFLRRCRQAGLPLHPARFAESVPRFFVKFLTTKGDLVLDPFAGSNTVGWVAEQSRRNWLAIDIDEQYLETSWLRFCDDSVHMARQGQRRGLMTPPR